MATALLQTALASWTNYRHTTVLLSEKISAECGAVDQRSRCYRASRCVALSIPARKAGSSSRGPSACWRLTPGRLLPDQPDLVRLLSESATRAHDFSDMAARRLRGVPLSDAEYHDSVLLGSDRAPVCEVQDHAESGPRRRAGEARDRRARSSISPRPAGRSSTWRWAVRCSLSDCLVTAGSWSPASGGVYSYHELVADRPLDDEAWRKRSDPPLPWTPQAQPGGAATAQSRSRIALAFRHVDLPRSWASLVLATLLLGPIGAAAQGGQATTAARPMTA